MSTTVAATLLLIGLFLVLVFLRVPIVYAIGIASLADFFYLGINPMQMALKFVGNLNSYTLLAVPFFILMGELMSAGGITDTLIDFSKELVGWFRPWSMWLPPFSSEASPAPPRLTARPWVPLRLR